jgi:hypothetical protein
MAKKFPVKLFEGGSIPSAIEAGFFVEFMVAAE